MKLFENISRTILKSITYRIICIITQSIITYYFTSNLAITSSVVVVFQVLQTFIYYIHERLWARAKWGYND